MTIKLVQGNWEDAPQDIIVDATLPDPPYGAKTHEGNADTIADIDRNTINYTHWTPEDVKRFVASWSPRTRGWMACMTSDDLIQVYRAAYAAAGRFDFAPVPILSPRVRLIGDGPSSCAVYLMVARPRAKEFMSWGTLPGWYEAPVEKNGIVTGAKPVSLCRKIVSDYSRPGHLVADQCAGGASMLIGAALEGRHAIGWERDPETFRKATARVRKEVDSDQIEGALAREADRPKRIRGKQMGLPGMD